MSKKEYKETMAVIDIGSNELRLKIAQSGKSKLKYIESLHFPISLGRDTFDIGKISFEKVDKTCQVLSDFLKVAGEYDVSQIKAVATSAISEASNQEYILDQIKIKTSLSINVIDDIEEKFYIYKLMSHLIKKEFKDAAMMVYIGSGNVGISLLEDDKLSFMQNVKMGTLRISEIFGTLQEYTNEFYIVLEEYVASFTDTLQDNLDKGIKTFIASGSEIPIIAQLCGVNREEYFLKIPKEKFNKLYNEIKFKTVDRIQVDYNLPIEKAELLLPAICVYKSLLDFTAAETIIAPVVHLSDSVLFEMMYPVEFAAINKDFNKSTILTSRLLAKKYLSMEEHHKMVEKFALKIFDKMKKIHGLGLREKLYLQTAAILHDIGKFINVKNHYKHSYNIISGSDIVGLNKKENKIVALLAYYHSRLTPSVEQGQYKSLDSETKVLVSKLAAILRLADALDRSHNQKFDEIEVKITEDELIVTIITDKNTELEEWSFVDKGRFFEEVFGIKAVIKKKRVM